MVIIYPGLDVFFKGFTAFNSKNLTPFIPSEFGFNGVARGATSAFFGYMGYDEVIFLC